MIDLSINLSTQKMNEKAQQQSTLLLYSTTRTSHQNPVETKSPSMAIINKTLISPLQAFPLLAIIAIPQSIHAMMMECDEMICCEGEPELSSCTSRLDFMSCIPSNLVLNYCQWTTSTGCVLAGYNNYCVSMDNDGDCSQIPGCHWVGNHSKMSMGAIVGIAVGALFVFFGLVGLGCYCHRRNMIVNKNAEQQAIVQQQKEVQVKEPARILGP
jgi:hypothetical protein